MDNIALRKRYDVLKTERTNIEGVWNWIQRFVIPYSGIFFSGNTSETERDWRRRDIFDSTAIIANQNLAANIHTNVTNPLVRWFDIRFRRSAINAMHEAKMWIEEVSYLMYLALQESNFNLEANELYLELPSYGTGFIAEGIREKPDGSFKSLDFECMPLYESYFEPDSRGRIIRYYRKLMWTPCQMVDKFGKESVPEHIREKSKTPQGLSQRHELFYVIYRRENVIVEDIFQKTDEKSRPFGEKYILYSSAEDLGSEGGFYEMPIFAPRWRQAAGSMWGYSPAMVCISDILTLNQMVELVLKSAEKVVDPPIMQTRRGVIGNINLEAGKTTTVRDMESMAPFESRARFDVSQLVKEDIQRSINRTFFMDQLQLKESPAMTATEVNVRFQLMQRLLGPTLGRLQSDFLDPLIERTFKVLYRYQMLPPPPRVVMESGAELEIEYLGTMARAQKYDEIAATERWLGDIAAMSERFPRVVNVVNEIRTGRDLGISMGVPSKYMNSQTEIERREDQEQQEQQVGRSLATAQAAGEAMKSVGEGRTALESEAA